MPASATCTGLSVGQSTEGQSQRRLAVGGENEPLGEGSKNENKAQRQKMGFLWIPSIPQRAKHPRNLMNSPYGSVSSAHPRDKEKEYGVSVGQTVP